MVFHTKYRVPSRDAGGRWMLLTYNLLEEAKWDGIHYGIEVELVGEQVSEKTFYLDITPNLSRAEALLSLLARNSVTPYGLPDVLEQWL